MVAGEDERREDASVGTLWFDRGSRGYEEEEEENG